MEKEKKKGTMSDGSSSHEMRSTDCCRHNKNNNRRLGILFYDSDAESSRQCSSLLRQCDSNYQVKAVYSASEVMNALNNPGGFETDIILAEAALLVSDGSHLLKYITHSNDFKHIPVIMMFGEDDVSMVFKGLGFGATDYIMKPLGATEVLNLWTHIRNKSSLLP